MATGSLSDDIRAEARLHLRSVISTFRDDIGSVPTLGEFLEIIGLALISVSKESGLPSGVVGFDAKVGRTRYQSQQRSRVSELNDSAFADATAFLATIGTACGRVTSSNDLETAILEILQDDGVAFEDVRGSDVSRVAAVSVKSVSKPKVGDILAIPVGDTCYRMAVVTARNRFGTAIGLIGLSSAFPRVSGESLKSTARRSIYTDDQLIVSGMWKTVGHDDKLPTLFPTDPEIYHGPDPIFPNVELGEFGAAERASGEMRQLTRSEAEEVGLLNNSYRQLFVSAHLHQLLQDGTI
jgi:hypothetical protein